ncbi:MAG TPA: tetratricopeptide repeat protein [Candidatus Binatia bacterium]|nr:tetratricopeptide repeat protein [Candidatus Binatia bacterium]
MRDAAHPPFLRGSDREKRIGREALQLVAAAQTQAARFASMANRPDLALEDGRWMEQHAEGDTMTLRQADFVAAGTLRALGRTNEAVERMRAMLRRYEPVPPPKGTSQEDEILGVPELMAQLRRERGDEAGAQRELDYGNGYFKGLLEKPREPMLEALIRARIVRTDLELRRSPDALEQVTALEKLVAAHPDLKALTPELRYSRAKIELMSHPTDPRGIAMLDAFAREFPKHNLAPRALFDAAVYREGNKQFPAALATYREVVALYPRNLDVAPAALFREAMLEEQTGAWDQAKATLESIPVKYPRTQAAVEAPITIATRYAARGDQAAAAAALARAITVYESMIVTDSTSVFAPLCRYNIIRGHLVLKQWDKALAAVDDMAAHHPRNPYTAQALVDGARVAAANGQRDRAAGYLQLFLENFPNSPALAEVRQQKDALMR